MSSSSWVFLHNAYWLDPWMLMFVVYMILPYMSSSPKKTRLPETHNRPTEIIQQITFKGDFKDCHRLLFSRNSFMIFSPFDFWATAAAVGSVIAAKIANIWTEFCPIFDGQFCRNGGKGVVAIFHQYKLEGKLLYIHTFAKFNNSPKNDGKKNRRSLFFCVRVLSY